MSRAAVLGAPLLLAALACAPDPADGEQNGRTDAGSVITDGGPDGGGSSGGSSSGGYVDGGNTDPCLPFVMPSKDDVLNANKKVFALYFGNFFSLSDDNKPSASDMYANWLGDFLRSRPLGVPVQPSSDYSAWQQANYRKEIELAIARGINGFAYEISNIACTNPGYQGGCPGTLKDLSTAAAQVDPRFTIALEVDGDITGGASAIVDILHAVCSYPNLYRINGELFVTAWLTNSLPASDWSAVETEMANSGCPIHFVANFLSVDSSTVATYSGVSRGFGLFATAVPSEGESNTNVGNLLGSGESLVGAVGSQHYRPSSFVYWEAQGSLSFRNGWMSLVQPSTSAPIPWVEITTWNDFSENTQIQPYTDSSLSASVGTGYYDLNGYYASWYLTGRPPAIDHDVVYYFYRREPASAAAPSETQPTKNGLDAFPGVDEIETLAFLTEPASLKIEIGGKSYVSDILGPGVQSFRAPLAAGVPVFSVMRNQNRVLSFSGQTQIYGQEGLPGGHLDLTYWSGSASASGVCSVTVPSN